MSAVTAIRRYEQFILGNKRFSLKGPYDVVTVRPEEEKDIRDELDSIRIEQKKKKSAETIARVKEEDALAVIRYAVRHILRWEPQDAAEHLTPNIISKLKLNDVIKYVSYPPDVSRSEDIKAGCPWLISRAFPNDVKYDMQAQLLKVYEKVKKGEQQFPRYMFRGAGWDRKLAFLLNNYLSTNIPTGSVEDLYKLFAIPTEGNKILRKACLFYAYRDFYDSPLAYLHSALGNSGDDFYYNYYSYCEEVREVLAEENAAAQSSSTTHRLGADAP